MFDMLLRRRERRFDDDVERIVRREEAMPTSTLDVREQRAAECLAATLAPLREVPQMARERTWQRIQTQIAGETPVIRRAGRGSLRSRPRAVTALIAVTLALLLVAQVSGATSLLLDRVLRRDAGTARVAEGQIGQQINLSQTIQGITVTVQRAYADANRIVVGYTITVPDSVAADYSGINGAMTLSDDTGRAYPIRGEQGQHDRGAHDLAQVVSFDAASLPQGIKSVRFSLTVTQVTAIRLPTASPTAPPIRPTEQRGGGVISLQPIPADQLLRVPGPWRFSLSLPVRPGRVAAVDQTVIANGIPVQLERIAVTPSETRAYLRFPANQGNTVQGWSPTVMLAVDGWNSSDASESVVSWLTSDGERVVSFDDALDTKHGEWTLTVEALGNGSHEGNGSSSRLVGPWVFRFTVP